MGRLAVRLLALLYCTVPLGAQTWTPATYNTSMFDHWAPTNPGGRNSALWGYTAPDGREYALLGGYDATYIVDITERPVRLVTKIPGPHNGWRELKTFSHYAYVVSEGGEGLQIIDLDSLPVSARLLRSDTSVFRTGHTVSVDNRYLYVHGTNVGAGANQGTIIFDLLPDPEHPLVVGQYTERYAHDAVIYNDTMYVAAITSGRLDIVYLGSDRSTPMLVTSITYPGAGTHNSDLTQDHRYIMTSDEISTTPKTLKIWDQSDLQNIIKVADYTPVPGEIIHNVHRKGNLAFIAWYTAGTRVIDVSNPREPAEVGFFDTFDGAGPVYNGNWETYPYFPSGKVIASDMQNGLYVFTLNGARRGRVYGTVQDAETGYPVPNALIELPGLGRSIRTDALGKYFFAGAVDTISFQATALNYLEETGELIVAPATGGDAGEKHDILLQPIPLAALSIRAIDAETLDTIPSFSISVVERQFDQQHVPGPYTLILPRDSAYHVVVGSWGYRQSRILVPRIIDGEVVVKLQRGYHDNVEVDLGWMPGMLSDTVVAGAWVRGVPVETMAFDRVVQPGTQTTPLGRFAFFTGLEGSTDGAGANDVDDGFTSLVSPVIRLKDSVDPWVNASYWYSRDVNTTVAPDDTFELSVSGDNGRTWTELAAITESPDVWTRGAWRLRDYLALTDSMYFRAVCSDRGRPSLVEGGIDDFSVTDGGPGPTLEDSGTVDTGPTVGVDGRLSSIAGEIFPNPASTDADLVLQLDRPLTNGTLDVIDARGGLRIRLVNVAAGAGEFRLQLPVAVLPSGTYRWRMRGSVGIAHGSFVVSR